MKILVDVDGVVADLMGGMSRYVKERYSLNFDVSKITHFHIDKSPDLAELHAEINLTRVLENFLAVHDVYERYVDPIPGAVNVIKKLAKYNDVIFVTATLDESPQSYVSKFRWLRDIFGTIPMISCPSKYKCFVRGDVGIDDRYDTCKSWDDNGTRGMLFRQSWNEAPSEYPSYDWSDIEEELL